MPGHTLDGTRGRAVARGRSVVAMNDISGAPRGFAPAWTLAPDRFGTIWMTVEMGKSITRIWPVERRRLGRDLSPGSSLCSADAAPRRDPRLTSNMAIWPP